MAVKSLVCFSAVENTVSLLSGGSFVHKKATMRVQAAADPWHGLQPHLTLILLVSGGRDVVKMVPLGAVSGHFSNLLFTSLSQRKRGSGMKSLDPFQSGF